MATKNITISSPAFEAEATIPQQYSCEGAGINPAFHFANLPEGTQTIALIAEDPDASKGIFVHWVAWNIDPQQGISEGSNAPAEGKNSAGATGYTAPCPPTGSHRYYFRAYALDVKLDLPPDTDKDGLLQAMQPHVLGEGALMGRYQKQSQPV